MEEKCKTCNRMMTKWGDKWIHNTPTNLMKEFCDNPEPKVGE